MWVTVQAGFETVLSGHCWTSSCAFEQRWCMFYLSVMSLSCFCKTCFCLNWVTLCSWDTSEYVTIYSNIPARMLCQMRKLMFMEQISGVWLESACSFTNLTVPQIVRVLLFQNNLKWSPIKKKWAASLYKSTYNGVHPKTDWIAQTGSLASQTGFLILWTSFFMLCID